MRTTREPSTTTPRTSALSSPRRFPICEPILSGSSRKEWHALERDRRFEFAWKHLRSYGEMWGPLLDEARQLHAAGQLFENVREEQEEEVPETVAMLAEPEEQDMDDHESNASTDVAQDHMRDPELEWLEPPVEAPLETPAQRMSHFLALRLVWGSPSALDLRQAAARSQE